MLIEETNYAPQLLCVDSFIIQRFQLDVLIEKALISSNELGKFKIEGTYSCGIILSPRNWILYNNHEAIMKIKKPIWIIVQPIQY